ncbi:MAG: aminoacyl-tRNA hydrolase [Candidatus Pacebacteria bacterium]|nr:aminoacyl-tRNA hydrolase [Candidatus Paceibacterota bacterium]
MCIVVGLGNPGSEYVGTRHNVGQMVLTHVMESYHFSDMVRISKYAGHYAEGTICSKEVDILFPDTFMNKSGVSVGKVLATRTQHKPQLVVVYDDVAIPVGELKISFGRGSGGHNGINSIVDAIGTKDFARIRVGIAPKTLFGAVARPKGARMSTFVLGKFSRREQKAIEDVAQKVSRALRLIVTDGVEKAMNELN